MKTLLKILGSTVLILLCTAIILFSGFFLWSAIPRERPEPQVLNMGSVFLEEEADLEAAPPVVEAPPQDTVEAPVEQPEPPAEEPELPTEEVPEEPIVEEPPVEDPVEEEPVLDHDYYAQMAQAYLDTMTLDEKIWQLMIATPETLTGQSPVTIASPWTEEALDAKPVGGLVYFSSNLLDRQQTIDMLSKTRTYAKTPLFLAVDEEGGSVSRVGANEAMGTTWFDPAATYGATGDMGQVYQVGKTMAAELTELGFNLNFAPVADVVTNNKNTEIGNRAYAPLAEDAAPLVASMVDGLQRGGMVSCLKHFPGHGSTEADSHEGKSVSTRTLQQMQHTEWRTFRAGIESGAAFVMMSHLTNTNLSELPSSLSPEVMGYLRDELEFDGVIITDSLQMGAIINYYTSAQAAVMALTAGADMLLMPNDLQTAFDGIAAAIADGTLTEERINESVLRILTVKYQFGIMQ